MFASLVLVAPAAPSSQFSFFNHELLAVMSLTSKTTYLQCACAEYTIFLLQLKNRHVTVHCHQLCLLELFDKYYISPIWQYSMLPVPIEVARQVGLNPSIVGNCSKITTLLVLMPSLQVYFLIWDNGIEQILIISFQICLLPFPLLSKQQDFQTSASHLP